MFQHPQQLVHRLLYVHVFVKKVICKVVKDATGNDVLPVFLCPIPLMVQGIFISCGRT